MRASENLLNSHALTKMHAWIVSSANARLARMKYRIPKEPSRFQIPTSQLLSCKPQMYAARLGVSRCEVSLLRELSAFLWQLACVIEGEQTGPCHVHAAQTTTQQKHSGHLLTASTTNTTKQSKLFEHKHESDFKSVAFQSCSQASEARKASTKVSPAESVASLGLFAVCGIPCNYVRGCGT